MIEAHTYDEVCTKLAQRFETAYRPRTVNLTGLLFAIPESKFAKEEIVPNINYWHVRSDNVTDFFCAGFGSGDGTGAPPDRLPIKGVLGDSWWFSAERFAAFISDIEGRSSWKYSGGANLILATTRYDSKTKAAAIDFRSAIVVNLDAMLEDGVIKKPDQLMQLMFQFAQNLNEDTTDPVRKLSDQAGFGAVKSGFIGMFWEVVSKFLGKGFKAATHFAVRDISPTPPAKK